MTAEDQGPCTHKDLLTMPKHGVAEVIDGDLFVTSATTEPPRGVKVCACREAITLVNSLVS